MEARQERARAAAGYVPPGLDGKTPLKRPPPPRPMQVTSSISLTVQPGVPTRIPIKKRGVAPLPKLARCNPSKSGMTCLSAW
jgi:hypothetical protein